MKVNIAVSVPLDTGTWGTCPCINVWRQKLEPSRLTTILAWIILWLICRSSFLVRSIGSLRRLYWFLNPSRPCMNIFGADWSCVWAVTNSFSHSEIAKEIVSNEVLMTRRSLFLIEASLFLLDTYSSVVPAIASGILFFHRGYESKIQVNIPTDGAGERYSRYRYSFSNNIIEKETFSIWLFLIVLTSAHKTFLLVWLQISWKQSLKPLDMCVQIKYSHLDTTKLSLVHDEVIASSRLSYRSFNWGLFWLLVWAVSGWRCIMG